jgi:hypothetical protein
MELKINLIQLVMLMEWGRLKGAVLLIFIGLESSSVPHE